MYVVRSKNLNLERTAWVISLESSTRQYEDLEDELQTQASRRASRPGVGGEGNEQKGLRSAIFMDRGSHWGGSRGPRARGVERARFTVRTDWGVGGGAASTGIFSPGGMGASPT